MRKIILIASPMVMLMSLPASAQSVSLVFGPLDGDSAGVLRTYENATVDVVVWIRTEPGIRIVGMHLPLSSRSEYIAGRNGGVFEDLLRDWTVTDFLSPEEDPQHDGYTNQSIMAVCDDPSDAIETNGEWWKIATYKMTSDSTTQFDNPFCDAFIQGYSPVAGELILADIDQGELDPSQYELFFACLEFEEFCGDYIKGDYNGNGVVNIADLIAAWSWILTGSPDAAVMCECPPGSGEEFAVAFDLDNSCTFDIFDICVFSLYMPEFPHLLTPCEYCALPGY